MNYEILSSACVCVYARARALSLDFCLSQRERFRGLNTKENEFLDVLCPLSCWFTTNQCKRAHACVGLIVSGLCSIDYSDLVPDANDNDVPGRDFSSTGSAALTIFKPVSSVAQYSSIVCRTIIQW
jgi:hypothetical protein